jgi:hypothetical protein
MWALLYTLLLLVDFPAFGMHLTPEHAASSSDASLTKACFSPSSDQSHTRPVRDFHSVYTQLLQSPVDSLTLKQWALDAIVDGLRYYDVAEPDVLLAHSDTHEKFLAEMARLWKSFAEIVALSTPHPNAARKAILPDSVIEFLNRSLKHGILPIPNIGHPEHYRYSSLRNYFFMGIVPISIDRTDCCALSVRLEHPLYPSYFESPIDLLQHDLQHADVMGQLWTQHQLTDITKRKKFEACFRSIPGENEKNNRIRRAIYYLLHEGDTTLLNAIHRPFNQRLSTSHILEVALERTINKKGFSLIDLIQGSEQEPTVVCKSIFASLQQSETIMGLRHLLPYSEIESWIDSHYMSRTPRPDNTTNLQKWFSTSFAQKLRNVCREYFKIPPLPSLTEPLAVLDAHFSTFADKAFGATLLSEMDQLYNEIFSVVYHLTNPENEDCVEFEFWHEPDTPTEVLQAIHPSLSELLNDRATWNALNNRQYDRLNAYLTAIPRFPKAAQEVANARRLSALASPVSSSCCSKQCLQCLGTIVQCFWIRLYRHLG